MANLAKETKLTVLVPLQVTEEVDVCSITYDRKEQTATAKTVEVDFKKECKSNSVTVCEPKPAYGYQHPPPPPPREDRADRNLLIYGTMLVKD